MGAGRYLIASVLAMGAVAAHAAKDGELWEFSVQIARDGGALGPTETNRMCFAKSKNFKEPPEKDDPSCKHDYKTVGKKTTFKSVCKDRDGQITSSGTTEELGPNHFRSDINVVQEMRGEPTMRQRQVSTIKRLGTACDPNEMMERFKSMGSPHRGAVESESAPSESKEPAAKSPAEKEPPASPSGGSVVDGAVEAGKSILKGILKF